VGLCRLVPRLLPGNAYLKALASRGMAGAMRYTKNRNQTYDSIWISKGHRYNIRITDGGEVYKPVYPPTDLLDDTFISERIKHITGYSIFNGATHSKLPTMSAEYVFWFILHSYFQTKRFSIMTSSDNMSDL